MHKALDSNSSTTEKQKKGRMGGRKKEGRKEKRRKEGRREERKAGGKEGKSMDVPSLASNTVDSTHPQGALQGAQASASPELLTYPLT